MIFLIFLCINNNDWPMDLLTNHVLSMFIASTQACGPLRGRPSPRRAQHRGPSRAAWRLSSCAVLRCPTLGWLLLCPCLLPPLCMIQAWARLAWEMPSLRVPSPGLQHPGRLWHRATEFQMKRLLEFQLRLCDWWCSMGLDLRWRAYKGWPTSRGNLEELLAVSTIRKRVYF